MIGLKHHVDALVGRQQSCPSGIFGQIVGKQMVRQHAPETLWTIALLDLAPSDRVLEIGCGAGRAIELAVTQVPDGQVTGIDLSRAMVWAASRRNARAIKEGRVRIRQGDVANLPFADGQFDKILSIHTLYFWPDPARAVAEMRRVLKPGGVLALTLSPGKVGAMVDAGYRAIVDGQVMPAMERLGFAPVSVERGPDSRQYRTVVVIGVRKRHTSNTSPP
jgi:ubiquinone/menaquinone biosynthesis C-methylase UbiE